MCHFYLFTDTVITDNMQLLTYHQVVQSHRREPSYPLPATWQQTSFQLWAPSGDCCRRPASAPSAACAVLAATRPSVAQVVRVSRDEPAFVLCILPSPASLSTANTKMLLFVQTDKQTNRQTDRQTDTNLTAIFHMNLGQLIVRSILFLCLSK